MLFVFTGNTQKRWPSEKVGSGFPAGKGRYQRKSGWGGAPRQCGQETESQYPGHTERKELEAETTILRTEIQQLNQELQGVHKQCRKTGNNVQK